MTMTVPDDLLVLAAIDFGDGAEWFAADWDRALRSMTLGKAGDVRHGRAAGAALATRAERPVPRPQIRRASLDPQDDGSLILLSGRIHHADELRARYALPPCRSHVALYAALYQRLGEKCDSLIAGNYAVVQWFPGERRLRLARSPMSEAPLHVMRDGARIVVSSLPGPIMALGHVQQVDDGWFGAWNLLARETTDRSPYRGIATVACGTAETHTPAGRKVERYWSVDALPDVRFARDEDYVEAVVEQLRRATDATIGDARRPGLLLSGGFDSQAIAAFAVERLGPDVPLPTYTSVPARAWQEPEDWPSIGDEGPYVRALGAMYPQLRQNFIDGAHLHLAERLDAFMLVTGWPMYNEAMSHWLHPALEQAAGDGVDLMMVGDAGNTGFSYDGLTGFATWLQQGRLIKAVREVRAYSDPRPFLRKFLSLAIMPHVPARVRAAIDRHRAWDHDPFATWSPLRRDYAESSGLLTRMDEIGYDTSFYDTASSRDWRSYMVRNLTVGGPEIGLGHQLLYGVPMRDVHGYVPLLELCTGIADDQYLRNGQDRWLARRVLKGRVPDMVWQETRSMRQCADWTWRMNRDRERIIAELEDLGRDDRIAAMFDIPRLVGNLRNWDGENRIDRQDVYHIQAAVTRGLSGARFLRFAEGRNGG